MEPARWMSGERSITAARLTVLLIRSRGPGDYSRTTAMRWRSVADSALLLRLQGREPKDAE